MFLVKKKGTKRKTPFPKDRRGRCGAFLFSAHTYSWVKRNNVKIKMENIGYSQNEGSEEIVTSILKPGYGLCFDRGGGKG